jgi:hypothetical protein
MINIKKITCFFVLSISCPAIAGHEILFNNNKIKVDELIELKTVSENTSVFNFENHQKTKLNNVFGKVYKTNNKDPFLVLFDEQHQPKLVWNLRKDFSGETFEFSHKIKLNKNNNQYIFNKVKIPDEVVSPSCLGGNTIYSDNHDLKNKINNNFNNKAVSPGVNGIIAIDTDNEFMANKFSNNTTSATQYIQALIASINVFYARDLGLTLELGEIILRTGTDPYTQTDVFAQLVEFGTWWQNNRANSPRAFAAMLSGKNNNPFSATGIAWVLMNGNYCTSTSGNGGHYSVNRVFMFQQNTVAIDSSLVGHEIGHNLGANHTHCTDSNPGLPGLQPVDMCFNGEPSSGSVVCYSGPESCPAGGPGTLMSYCNLSSANCGDNLLEFHPVHINLLETRINQNTPSCLTVTNTNLIFNNGFEP